MKNFKISLAILFAFSLLSACSEETNPGTPEPATFTITAPQQDAVFMNGDTVFIQASMTAPASLHGYDVMIREQGDTTDVFYLHKHTHETTLTVDTFWVNTYTSHTMLDVIFRTYLDHDGHTSIDTVSIMAH